MTTKLQQKTFGNLKLVNSAWTLIDIEPHVVIRLKQLFPRIPKSSSKLFTLNDTLETASDLLWFTQRYPLSISDTDLRYLKKQEKQFNKEQAQANSILMPTYTPNNRAGLLDGQSFRNYQLTGLDLIEAVKRTLIIDDVGLGKTYLGLGIGLLPNTLPIVFVVEPHLQDQWAEKASEFINLSVYKPKGNTPYLLPKADIYIFKYSQLSPWVDVLAAGWVKAIVYDEVQQLRRGTESNRGMAALGINQVVPVVVGLTATLIYNYGIEAFNISNMIRPGVLGSKEEFLREWCSSGYGQSNDKGIVTDPDSLGSYLKEAKMMLRRTKADVGQVAMQLEPHIEWVSPNMRKVADMEVLAEQLAVKTLSGSYMERGQAAREFDLKMREMTGIAKAHSVAAYVRMFIESGTPLILFGWHRAVYEIWEKELSDLNPLLYTGSESQVQKERNKKAFIAGESDLLIMSLRSGAGTDGIQHRCSTVIFGEEDWSPQVMTQCIGRVDRDGQLEPVFVFHAVTNYGCDPEILALLGVKSSQARGIQDPGSKLVGKQTDADRIKKLAHSYLKSRGVTPPAMANKDSELNISDLRLVI
ncbi:DEAD/DEAH box helicase [Shewanella sp. BF02_Schw]|uniref:SNF2-related protein n=1 Tax=Shewanella sp. BF02_Schw TaxID=394908 RepID=UPI00178076A3|nr:DEAD/DEAH box helicase [Shewanella sp. BF02_Schw]MBO1897744.1 DEAD/DEAH box helicase [Shewanella sp. BF02_Schw]